MFVNLVRKNAFLGTKVLFRLKRTSDVICHFFKEELGGVSFFAPTANFFNERLIHRVEREEVGWLSLSTEMTVGGERMRQREIPEGCAACNP